MSVLAKKVMSAVSGRIVVGTVLEKIKCIKYQFLQLVQTALLSDEQHTCVCKDGKIRSLYMYTDTCACTAVHMFSV